MTVSTEQRHQTGGLMGQRQQQQQNSAVGFRVRTLYRSTTARANELANEQASAHNLVRQQHPTAKTWFSPRPDDDAWRHALRDTFCTRASSSTTNDDCGRFRYLVDPAIQTGDKHSAKGESAHLVHTKAQPTHLSRAMRVQVTTPTPAPFRHPWPIVTAARAGVPPRLPHV